jgi:hypothetical protein
MINVDQARSRSSGRDMRNACSHQVLVATGAASLLKAIGGARHSSVGRNAMVRYGLIGFAAAILLAASLVPDDALARGGGRGGGGRGGGGFHGGGARAAHVGGGAGRIHGGAETGMPVALAGPAIP